MSVTQTEQHIARKQHRCTWCEDLIAAGEHYARYRFFPEVQHDADEPGTVKMHPECLEAMQKIAPLEFEPGSYRRGCACLKDDDCECEKPMPPNA